ncbi:MAG TPA: phosphatidate cytidylyltransferase [Bryobacteraceae bacterium]|jgi:phosphatidate cytidylyltransferase|nr:phosphatidate cytidylyltransferase [Bryobacteraceae bacterium]
MKRILTALVLIPLITYAMLWAPYPIFLAVLAAIAGFCFYEYGRLVSLHSIPPPGVFGYAAGFLVLLLPTRELAIIGLIVVLGLALGLRLDELNEVLPYAGALILGVLYVFGGWRHAVLLHDLSPYWLLFAVSLNWVGDIAAFYVGRTFGRHKLAPRVSPAKSWEGSIASIAASVLMAYLYFPRLLPDVPLLAALGIAAAGNVAGQIGDLCESALKRGAGVKDSGTLLPGHGGWLDRVDSVLFALPVVYFLAARLH